MKLLIILLSLVSFSAWCTPLTHQEFTSLSLKQRVEVLDAYKDFLRSQNEELAQSRALSWGLWPEAFATDNYDCVYAGWPSVRLNGRCSNPARHNSLYQSHASACSGAKLVCNPLLFGANPVLCADTVTQAQRNGAFAQCETRARGAGRTTTSIAQGLAVQPQAAQADELFQTVNRICTTGAQASLGVCRNLLARVSAIRAARGPEAVADTDAQATNLAADITATTASTDIVATTAANTLLTRGNDEQQIAPPSEELATVINTLTRGLPDLRVNHEARLCENCIEQAAQQPALRARNLASNIAPALPNVSTVRRLSCPRRPASAAVEDYDSEIRDYNITFYPDRASIEGTPAFGDFMFELRKFPPPLMREMAARGGTIRVIVGERGIQSDPQYFEDCRRNIEVARTYEESLARDGRSLPAGVPSAAQVAQSCETTFDGRSRSTTDGGGGVFSNANFIIPTRIVINRLYGWEEVTATGQRQQFNQGTSNLFLHEHAHALDGLNGPQSISTSSSWRSAISSASSRAFMQQILGRYELDNPGEGFSELFAYYHSCGAAQEQLRNYAPEIHRFFQNLSSARLR